MTSKIFHEQIIRDICERYGAKVGGLMRELRRLKVVEDDYNPGVIPDAWHIFEHEDGTIHVVVYEVENASPVNDRKMIRYADFADYLDYMDENLLHVVIYDRHGRRAREFNQYELQSILCAEIVAACRRRSAANDNVQAAAIDGAA